MNIKNINFLLNKANCYFNLDVIKNDLTINIEDKVVINDINEKKIEMTVSRKLFSSDIEKILVEVEFKVSLELSTKINIDELKKDINLGLPLLSSVFSRISVVISGITNYSILGPVVTIPDYDKSKIIIEEKKQ